MGSTGGRNGPGRGQEDGDNVRSQAVGVLARSGQLKETVARVEEQLKASPKSIQIHQTLLGYYEASADKEKQKAIVLRILELKPDDAKLRFKLAKTLNELGDKEAAIASYKVALKKDPSLFQENYYELQRLFSEANKFEELVAVVENADMKKLSSQSYYVMSMIEPMLEQPKSRDLGLKLFKKAWLAFPNERAQMLTQINRPELWKLPELFEYAREAVLTNNADSEGDPWQALQTGLPQLLAATRKQHRVAEFKAQVEAKSKADPKWLAGKALLAVLDYQSGEKARGKAAWLELFSDDKLDIPATARYALAKELEFYAGAEEFVIPTLEKGLDELFEPRENDYNRDFDSLPARRLIWWYEQVGRTDDARKLLVRVARTKPVNPGYDEAYYNYRRATEAIAVAAELTRLGDPIEAVRQLQALPSDPESIAALNRYGGDQIEQQVKDATKVALKAMTPEVMARGTAELLTPRPPEVPKPKPGAKAPPAAAEKNRPALDLALALEASRESPTPLLRSPVATALLGLKGSPDALKLAETRAAESLAKHPNDVSVRVAALLVALADGKPAAVTAAAEALAKLLDGAPLEVLADGAKPNSRQPAVGMLNVPVWLAARELLARDEFQALGTKLGGHALAGAKRQTDPKYATAILQEWGQIAAKRKDLPTAEAKWAELVTGLMPKPARKKPAPAATPAATPTPAPATPATPATPKGAQSRLHGLRLPTTYVQSVTVVRRAAPPAAAETNGVLTTEQFAQVYEVAKVALANDLTAFSLKLIRDAVRPGPPIAPAGGKNRNGGGSYNNVTVNGVQYLV